MKNLFFVAVATGIFTGATFSSKAQTNVNLERFSPPSPKPKTTLKFIEGIEIKPEQTGHEPEMTAVIPEDVKIESVAKGSNSLSASAIEQCSTLQFKYAMLMDKEVESISNIPLYSYIDEWWGTHYRYGGSDKNGIDCSAFVSQLEQQVFKINLPRTAKEQYGFCEKLSMDELREGDLVFFKIKHGVSHVGIYLGDNYFVHSSLKYGVTISSLSDDYYNRKFTSGGRPITE